jgi:SpoU rRNA methylase family enzyme
MLSARVTSNLPKVRKRYNNFFRRFPKIVTMGLEQAGVQLKEIILDRTDRGLDFNKRRFVPYSPSYAEEKGKTVVNLQDTNDMLQSIDSQVQLFFREQTQAKKALFHQKGLGKLPERIFFKFNLKTEKLIRRSFEQFMKKEIKRLKI